MGQKKYHYQVIALNAAAYKKSLPYFPFYQIFRKKRNFYEKNAHICTNTTNWNFPAFFFRKIKHVITTLFNHDVKRKKNQKIITKSLFICNLQCDFLVPVLKKTKMSQFSSPSKKTTIAPQKTMKNVLHYLEQQKKVWKKSCKKSWKTIEKKKYEKNYKTYTKNIWWMKKDYWTQWQFFESKEWKT